MSDGAVVYPCDLLEESIVGGPQKCKRKLEIHKWFTDFKSFCKENGDFDVDYDSKVVDNINATYWENMCESVRARLQPKEGNTVRADRHKIASLFELLIVHYQPFHNDDLAIKTDLNARCAFFVATNIIGNWGKVGADDLYVSKSFDREHRTWLKQLSEYPEGQPIFSNAATWYMVEKLFMERSGYRTES